MNDLHRQVLLDIIKQEKLVITFEGPTCCGKTTQAKMLSDFLKSKLGECCFIKSPIKDTDLGKTSLKLMQDDDPYVSCLAGLLNRYHIQDLISRTDCCSFVVDRWNLSYWVYQLKTTGIQENDPMFAYWASMYPDKIQPQFQFYLDVDKDVLTKRLEESNKKLNKWETSLYLDKANAAYKQIIKSNNYSIISVKNQSVEETFDLILHALKKRLEYLSH